MASLVIQTKGFIELGRKLKELPDKVARNVVGQSLREGAKIFQSEIDRTAPVGQHDKGPKSKYPHKRGLLKRTIRVRVGKTFGDKNRKKILVYTGSRQRGAGGAEPYYVFWVEHGHRYVPRKERQTATQLSANKSIHQLQNLRSKGRIDSGSAGRRISRIHDRHFGGRIVQAHPFIRPAFDNRKDEAIDRIAERMRNGIIAEAFKS